MNIKHIPPLKRMLGRHAKGHGDLRRRRRLLRESYLRIESVFHFLRIPQEALPPLELCEFGGVLDISDRAHHYGRFRVPLSLPAVCVMWAPGRRHLRYI